MAGLDELRVTFFEECSDLLGRLSDGLRTLSNSQASADVETVHAVFRAVHSIKGGAAAFGLDDVVGFAHQFETVLDELRSGRLTVDATAMETFLRAGDILADLVANARDGSPVSAERAAQISTELELLAGNEDDEELEPFEFVPLALSFESLPIEKTPEPKETEYLIALHPLASLYASGNEPAPVIRALSELGKIEVTPNLNNIRPLAEIDLDNPQLSWQICLTTAASIEEVTRVFEFIEDIAEINVTSKALEHHDGQGLLSPAVETPKATLPSIVNEPEATIPAAITTSAAVDSNDNIVKIAAPATIRVNLDRVDRLINLIGELVIMEAALAEAIAGAGLDGSSDAATGLDRMRQLAGEIQEVVMAIRAQPLRPVFQRMERILREANEVTGKKSRLIMIGEATEVDKTMIERLVDPLTHMIRNSVDHGLEDPARRISVGKPAEGTITLSAAHRSGRVLIEVSDDGGGINRAKIRDVAEKKGLIAPNASLGTTEIDNLLFMPGFSSKSDVSELSGRGVGLDVVRREIQSLGGRVSIASVEGAGTTFTIALPLTLAVLEGMLLRFGEHTMVIPISAIVETLSAGSACVHVLGSTGRVVVNRGVLVPVIDLGEVFGAKHRFNDDEKNESIGVFIIVETDAGQRAALAVDEILDQRQVVIKSLEDNYGSVPGISAATILGNGRVALIIDPEEVVRTVRPELSTPNLKVKR